NATIFAQNQRKRFVRHRAWHVNDCRSRLRALRTTQLVHYFVDFPIGSAFHWITKRLVELDCSIEVCNLVAVEGHADDQWRSSVRCCVGGASSRPRRTQGCKGDSQNASRDDGTELAERIPCPQLFHEHSPRISTQHDSVRLPGIIPSAGFYTERPAL